LMPTVYRKPERSGRAELGPSPEERA